MRTFYTGSKSERAVQRWFALMLMVVLAGCSSTPESGSNSRYALTHDTGPDDHFDESKIKPLKPVYEPPSAGGNKSPYEVWGKRYHVLPTAEGYVAEGIASWYGKKFHGYKTANGEVYDMYQLSAAHKSLPLPSYAEITNLENGRKILVRVNDRGPFHDNRIIDLSYAAAVRLDVVKKGTARVKIEVIDPSTWQGGMSEQINKLTPPVQVQVIALSQLSSAEGVKSDLAVKTQLPIRIVSETVRNTKLHKVQIGPVWSRTALQQLIRDLANSGYGQPIILPATQSN